MPGALWSRATVCDVCDERLHLFLLVAKYFSSASIRYQNSPDYTSLSELDSQAVLSALFGPVGQEPFDSFYVTGTHRNCLIIKTLNALGFSNAQMTLPAFSPHKLTATGKMKTGLGTFMGLNFWHLRFFYLLFDYFRLGSSGQR